MKLKAKLNGYNYWLGINKKGKVFYNITPENQKAPKGGYYSSEYISKIKNVPNLFNTL